LIEYSFAIASERKTLGTSLVVDCGHGTCSVVPVFEGYVVKEAINTSAIAGQLLTHELAYALACNNGMLLVFVCACCGVLVADSINNTWQYRYIPSINFARLLSVRSSTMVCPCGCGTACCIWLTVHMLCVQ
jgi:hypothetical protein